MATVAVAVAAMLMAVVMPKMMNKQSVSITEY